MIKLMKKRERIIIMHLKGISFRNIEKETGINRRTISSICHEYDKNQLKLQTSTLPESKRDDILRSIVNERKYDSTSRRPRKMIDKLLSRSKEIIDEEIHKTSLLGNRHKQKLDGKSVHEMITEEGFDINYRTMMVYWKQLNEKLQEAFVR